MRCKLPINRAHFDFCALYSAGLSAAVILVVIFWSVNNHAEVIKLDIDIDSQPADAALMKFADQTKLQITFSPDVVVGVISPGARGLYSLSAALGALLKGTGLVYQFTDKNTVVINRLKRSAPRAVSGKLADGMMDMTEVTVGRTGIEELVVTDSQQGIDVDLQDEAVSITVMVTEEIERKSIVSMADYLGFFPSITYLNFGTSWNQVTMRGLGVNLVDQATVSTYFGEVPLTLPFSLGISTDLKLVDMERVEVLRGPHGTIYGNGPMGGTVRNVPVAPNLGKFEGKLDLGYSVTDNSGGSNNKAVGIVNLPLIKDELALRLVGYRHDNAGYVDLVSTPEMESLAAETGTSVNVREDTAGLVFTGARASLLWQKSENFSLSFLYTTQKLHEDGYVDLNPPLGGYRRSELDVGFDPFKRDDTDIVNLVLKYNMGWGRFLISATEIEGTYTSRASSSFMDYWASDLDDTIDKKGSVQEIRLTSELPGNFQFLAGLFHEDHRRTRSYNQTWFGSQSSFIDANLGTDRNFWNSLEKNDFSQWAFFGELAYKITPEWELMVGGRWFDYDRRDGKSSVNLGYSSDSNLDTVESDSTWKTNLAYTPNEDTMIYARWAQGFRIGRGQSLPPDEVCDVDGDGKLDFTNATLVNRVDSDSINNYEIGAKLTFQDQRLAVNTALYNIEWKDVPVSIEATTDICRFRRVSVNGGDARLRGIESEVYFYPTPAFQLSLSLSYADNKYVSGSSVTVKNSRLPLSSKWVGSVAAQYNFDVAGYKAFLRSDYGYRDEFFQNNIGYIVLDAYRKLDMRAGIKFDDFSVELYGTNLTREDPLTAVWDPNWGYRLPPRVIGVNLSYEF